MPMISVLELVNDPDFAQSFQVVRNIGSWVDARFVAQATTFTMVGVIETLNTKDMVQVPAGDTITGQLNVYTIDPIYPSTASHTAGEQTQTTDEIVWHGESYKILSVQNFSDFGYYQATAVRKLGS